MDFLTFGLLAGSLIVIASFVVRDGAPHLAAIREGSRLGRLTRQHAPLAWERWCADVGLVLAAAGTLVLLLTVAALLLGVDDGTGSVVVALGITVAVLGAALGVARLTRRYRGEVEGHLGDHPLVVPVPATTRRVDTSEATSDDRPARPEIAGSPSLWDDDLPTWSAAASAERPPITASASDIEVVPDSMSQGEVTRDEAMGRLVRPKPGRGRVAEPTVRAPRRPTVDIPIAAESPTTAFPVDVEPAAVDLGGAFSSPLLAGIGPSVSEDEPVDGFRSPLLSNLEPVDSTGAGEGSLGADLLVDEAPAPVQPAARSRDEIDSR